MNQVLLTKKDNYDEEAVSLLSESLAALFGVATLSGNHDLLLQAMESLVNFAKLHSSDAEFVARVFQPVEPQLG